MRLKRNGDAMKTQKKCKQEKLLNHHQQLVLEAMKQYGYLTASMIRDILKISSLRTAQYHLQQLWEIGLIRRIRLSCQIGEGSRPYAYTLLRNGDFPKPIQGIMQLQHLLTVNQFIVSMQAACEQAVVSLDVCIPYYRKQELNSFLPGIEPDAILVLSRQDRQSLFFLEVDKGTEPVHSGNKNRSSISEKFRAYYNLFESGDIVKCMNFRKFRVLITVPDKQRRDALLRASKSEPHAHCLWFAIETGLATSNLLLDSIWHLEGFSEPQSIIKSS